MNKIDNNTVVVLLNQVASGNIKAATQLFSLFQGSVYAFIRLKVPNDEAAEEILNETFMIALTKPSQFDASSEYTTWLCGIAKNLCRNWWRKESSSRELFSGQDLDGLPLEYLEDPNPSVLANMEQRELQQMLMTCIEKLPDPQREAMFWVFYEGVSLDDAALKMACPPGTVKSRLFHARAKIAQCVKLAFGLGGERG